MAPSAISPSSSYTCSIPDMECPNCAMHVERALDSLDGVTELSVSVIGRRATVRYDPGRLGPEQLIDAIHGAGYTVASTTEPPSGTGALLRSAEALRTLLSSILFFAGLAGHVLWPESAHASLWRGHIGPSDILLVGAALVGGYNFFPQALRDIRRLNLGIDFLMTAAIFGAIAIGEYAEAGAIAFLFSTAELLEDYAVERARGSIRALMKLAPDTAVVRRDGVETTIAAADVSRGEIVLLRPGDRVPVDGQVVLGSSTIDQAPITGESMPVHKETADEIYAGTIVQEGYLEARATQVAADTTLGRIIHMVEEAEEHRAPSEDFVRRFARYYTPAVAAVALGLMVLPPFALDADFATWFVRGLTLLVIACPCALVISTPIAVVSAITSAARNGVLIKGGDHLEQLATIRVVALDKTGTLTLGRPAVTRVMALGDRTESEVLQIAAALEQRSAHPLARAIVTHADGIDLPGVSEFESMTGLGVKGRLGNHTYMIGRPALFDGLDPSATAEDGQTFVVVGDEQGAIGVISFADAVRTEARDAVAALHRNGIRVVMLTGDNEATARAVGKAVGVDLWRAGLLPDDKVAAVRELTAQYGPVAMVGDGVNDAPAMVTAAVGIAMGAAGSDTALETADVALMGDNLSRLPYLLDLGRRSRSVIRQNVWTSILVKFTLAAGVVPGAVTLAAAVLVGDMGTSLAVAGNAMRLAGRGARTS